MQGFNERIDRIERELNRREARLAKAAVGVFWVLGTAWVILLCNLPHG